MAKTWVLVAESARAKIFTVTNAGKDLQEMEDLVHPESRLHEQKLTSDLPGRTFDSAGQGQHAMEEDTRPKEYEAETFAREIAQRLESARATADFDQLIIIAPPKFLGLLRASLSQETMKKVVHEVDKNLVHEDRKAILAYLPARL